MKSNTDALLVLAVTGLIFALLLADGQSWLVLMAVIIIVITLILVVGGAAQYLPAVLKTVLSELRRMIRS